MKRPGSILDFTPHRNAAMISAYRRCLRSATLIYLPDIYAQVAESPSPRFWVSEERATAVFNAMITDRPLPRMNANKLEMFREIYRRVLLLFDAKPHLTIPQLVSEVIHQPAPKFYMTPRTVGEYINRIKNAGKPKKR